MLYISEYSGGILFAQSFAHQAELPNTAIDLVSRAAHLIFRGLQSTFYILQCTNADCKSHLSQKIPQLSPLVHFEGLKIVEVDLPKN